MFWAGKMYSFPGCRHCHCRSASHTARLRVMKESGSKATTNREAEATTCMCVTAATLWSTQSQACRMSAMLQLPSDRSSGSQPRSTGTEPRCGFSAAALSAAMPCLHACNDVMMSSMTTNWQCQRCMMLITAPFLSHTPRPGGCWRHDTIATADSRWAQSVRHQEALELGRHNLGNLLQWKGVLWLCQQPRGRARHLAKERCAAQEVAPVPAAAGVGHCRDALLARLVRARPARHQLAISFHFP